MTQTILAKIVRSLGTRSNLVASNDCAYAYSTRPNHHGRIHATACLVAGSLCLIAIPVAGTLLAPSIPAEAVFEGAFEGGPTGTKKDVTLNNAIPESELAAGRGFDVPSGGKPSPLFGAQPFTQQMLLFEEFGTDPLPASYTPKPPALSTSAQQPVPGAEVDRFLAQPLYPAPTRVANTTDPNPERQRIEQFLGRAVPNAPAEGRPGGEFFAHQRWDEMPPRVYFESALAGAHANSGLRDARQRHGYAAGEFAPGGLYHNTTGLSGNAGTTRGIAIRMHPNMPAQDPLSLWTFDGTLPPKLLMSRYGDAILFRSHNMLPIDPSANRGFGLHTMSTHEHNGHNPAESDGFGSAFFFPGQYYDYRWPMILAGHDTINTDATDPRAGAPDGNGGIRRVRGDWREAECTHWFHDHMIDFTAQNVYKGAAAMMNYYSSMDRGNEAIADGVNLRLPSGTALDWGNRDYDVNLVIADKATTRDGQLWFNPFERGGFLGDVMTVNFQYKPYLDVRARKYRFRILNGCVARYLKIALVDERGLPVPYHIVAADGNIMEHSVALDGTLDTRVGELPQQSIGERFDIVVDFSRFRPGSKLRFINMMEHQDGKRPNRVIPLREITNGSYRAVARDSDRDGIADVWLGGDPCVGSFLEFRVHAYSGTDLSMNPQDFVEGRQTMIPIHRPTEAELASATHRSFVFGRGGGTDDAPWSIKTDDGGWRTANLSEVTATANIDSRSAAGLGHLEVWSIRNGGNGWSHPIHVHFEEGTVLTMDGRPPTGFWRWVRKDIYNVGPVESPTTFEIALHVREFAGTYVEHCHNTTHEDHAMLLRWDATREGQVSAIPTPIPSWDGVHYVESTLLPTALTGDGIGARR